MNAKDSVMSEATSQEGPTATTIMVEASTTTATTHPWMLFLYALKAPDTYAASTVEKILKNLPSQQRQQQHQRK